jgi:hypothetical protein
MMHGGDDELLGILPFKPLKNFSFREKPIVTKIYTDVIIETQPYKYTNQETLMTPYISGDLANLPLFQYNLRELVDEIYQKKEGDPYCLVKYKYNADNKDDNLKVDDKIKIQFDKYLIETKKILELVYKIYEEEKKDEEEKKKIDLKFLWIKDQEPTRGINSERRHSKHADSRSKDKMNMIKYVRNFQVIMMCEIYSFIKERYNAIKNLIDPKVIEKRNDSEVKKKLISDQLLTEKQIELRGDGFLNELNKLTRKQLLKVLEVLKTKYISDISTDLLLIVDNQLNNFNKFISKEYEINNEPKIKYIFRIFMDYLKKIYLPYIQAAFRKLSDYEKFNLFNVHYLINLLLLKNNIFFYKKLDITYFDLDGRVEDDIKDTKVKIDEINSILDNIDLFLNDLYENNPQGIIENGCKLLNIKPDIFEKELKKSLFFSNLLIDEALISIRPQKYRSEIINSPDSKYNFCNVIKKIPYTREVRTKFYGISDNVDKYKRTCLEKYEAMDYLVIKSPLSKFMLFYWSSLMNTYLTERAIKYDYNNILIWGKDNIIYDKDTRMVKGSRNRTSIKEIMTKKLYLGYIKLTLNDGIKVIFIFLNSYFIELFDIYGTPIQYGNYNPFSFSTSQEIGRHLYNKSIFNLVDTDKKNIPNKYIYLALKAFITGTGKVIYTESATDDDKKKLLDNTETFLPHNTETFFRLLNNTDRQPYWEVPSTPAEWHKEIEQAPEKEELPYWDDPEWQQQLIDKSLLEPINYTIEKSPEKQEQEERAYLDYPLLQEYTYKDKSPFDYTTIKQPFSKLQSDSAKKDPRQILS